MITNVENLKGKALAAKDGVVGRVKDVMFDDVSWSVRYLVVDTGSWLSSQKVLISPESLGKLGGRAVPEQLPVELSKKDVEGSPALAEDEPISRQYEREYADYYSHAHYWEGLTGNSIVVAGATPVAPDVGLASDLKRREEQHVERMEEIPKSHLRSVDEVCGYGVSASDGEIGSVADALVRLDDWKVRYFVIDTGSWLSSDKVVVSIEWVSAFDWSQRKARIDQSRESLESAPRFEPEDLIRADFETRVFRESVTSGAS